MKTVLIVDRNKHLLEALEEIFIINGYKVITANDGETALWKAQQNTLDIIVCDVFLPALSGYDLYMRLQSNKQTQSIPVVFFIAETSNAHYLRSMFGIPNDRIVFKPFAVEDLLDAAQNALTGLGSQNQCGAGSRV